MSDLIVWGSDCVKCGNTTPYSMVCDSCGLDEFTIPLYADAPAETTPSVLAINRWGNNGHLIADCARLGYLRADWPTLDVTYGYGTFWSVWKPDHLVGCDLNIEKSPIGRSVDFRQLPFPSRTYEVVVFDGPYKLNGQPTEESDERYGVDEVATWRDRMTLLRAGARECARVSRRMLLIKCQDQVVSSKIRWQTRAMADEVEPLGFGLKARFDFLGRRPQPGDRAQVNPEACSSQLLVFEFGWKWTDLQTLRLVESEQESLL